MTSELSPEQFAEVARLKRFFPFRIVWAMLDKNTGEFEAYAHYNRRKMNAAVRRGHHVFQAGAK